MPSWTSSPRTVSRGGLLPGRRGLGLARSGPHEAVGAVWVRVRPPPVSVL